MIGLGRMGSNMVRRLMRASHECIIFDWSAAAVEALAEEGAVGAASLDDLAPRLARGEADYADKLLSAMRGAFGGHRERP